MIKKVLIISSACIYSYASLVSNDSIKMDKSIIQISVADSKYKLDKYLKDFDKYDLFIEKINKYTLYVVNIEKEDSKEVLKSIKKNVKDAFFIKKSNFFEDKSSHIKTTPKFENNISQNNEYTTALQNFREKDYEKSYEEFSKLFFNDMGNILINFYLGRSAYETKRYDYAISAYDRILIKEPDNNRVRLELAQTYMKMNLYTQAIKEFEETLKGKLPPIVRKKVESNIAFMKLRQQKHFFNITALLGWAYDSNIDASADAGNFDIYSPVLNSIITLKNDGVEESASIFQMAAIASYKYKVNDNFFLNNSLTPMMLKYNNHKEKDIFALSLNIAPTYIQKDYKVEMGFLYDYIRLGHKGYQKNFYLNPKYTKIIDDKSLFAIGAKLGKVNYNLDSSKDAKVMELHNNYKYKTEKVGLFNFGINIGKELEINDDRTDISQNYVNFLISNSYDFLQDYTLYTQFSYKDINYLDKDINFLNKREDKKRDYSISLQKMISKGFLINLGTTYTNNSSNHEPFDYDKYTIKTNLLYSF